MASTALYCTVEELKTQIDKSGSDGPASDAALTLIITSISRWFDEYTNRPEGFVAEDTASVRYFPGTGKRVQWIDECVAVDAVAVKDSITDDEDNYTAWTVGAVGTTTGADVFPASGDPGRPDYNNLPYSLLVIGNNSDHSYFVGGKYTGKPGFRPDVLDFSGIPTVKVTARWGYAEAVPNNIKQACIIESARFFKLGEGAWADAIAGVDFGQREFVRGMHPATQMILRRYRKPSIGWTGGA